MQLNLPLALSYDAAIQWFVTNSEMPFLTNLMMERVPLLATIYGKTINQVELDLIRELTNV